MPTELSTPEIEPAPPKPPKQPEVALVDQRLAESQKLYDQLQNYQESKREEKTEPNARMKRLTWLYAVLTVLCACVAATVFVWKYYSLQGVIFVLLTVGFTFLLTRKRSPAKATSVVTTLLVLFGLSAVLVGLGTSGNSSDSYVSEAERQTSVADSNSADPSASLDVYSSDNECFVNPNEEFVVQRLSVVPHVTQIEAATKRTDRNKLLGKKREYTAAVSFRSDYVETALDKPPVAEGCDGGGTVEVFKARDDAVARDEYLGEFGRIAGYHFVCGTCVIRLSENMTDGQRAEMAEAIVASMEAASVQGPATAEILPKGSS